jgi:hypothetical protein
VPISLNPTYTTPPLTHPAPLIAVQARSASHQGSGGVDAMRRRSADTARTKSGGPGDAGATHEEHDLERAIGLASLHDTQNMVLGLNTLSAASQPLEDTMCGPLASCSPSPLSPATLV